MKYRFSSIIAIILVAFLIASCGNEAKQSNMQLLTTPVWIFSGATSTNATTYTLIPLLSNSTYKFFGNGTYTFTYQAVGQAGTWQFNADQTQFILQKGTVNERTLNITKLEVSKFEFQEIVGSDVTSYQYIKKN